MILLAMKTRNLSDNPGLLCMLNFKNLVFLLFFLSFLLFFFTSQSHLSDKPTIPDKNTAIVGTLKETMFFPFLCFPFPSQCCLLRFSHQIEYTNIGGMRSHKSVPAVLTETVA